MKITRRSAPPSYSVDAVASSVRSALSTSVPRVPQSKVNEPARAGTPGAFDAARLYPNLFAAQPSPALPFAGRSARAAMVRIGVLGSAAAAMLALVHR